MVGCSSEQNTNIFALELTFPWDPLFPSDILAAVKLTGKCSFSSISQVFLVADSALKIASGSPKATF